MFIEGRSLVSLTVSIDHTAKFEKSRTTFIECRTPDWVLLASFWHRGRAVFQVQFAQNLCMDQQQSNRLDGQHRLRLYL